MVATRDIGPGEIVLLDRAVVVAPEDRPGRLKPPIIKLVGIRGVPMGKNSEAKQFFSTYQPKSHLQRGPTEKFSKAGLEGDIRP